MSVSTSISKTLFTPDTNSLKTKLCEQLHIDKLDSLFREIARSSCVMDRQSEPLLDETKAQEELYALLSTLVFVPSINTLKGWFRKPAVLMNMVQLRPTDNFDHIFDTLKATSVFLQSQTRVDVDFSDLRPSRAIIRSSERQSLGPVRFMEVFERTPQSSSRKEKLCFVIGVDHFDIEDFLSYAKSAPDHVTFRLILNNDFIRALSTSGIYNLNHNSESTPLSISKVFPQIESLIESGKIAQCVHGDFISEFRQQRHLDKTIMLNSHHTLTAPFELSTHGTIDSRHLMQLFQSNPEALKDVFRMALNLMDHVFDMNFYSHPEAKTVSQQKRRVTFHLSHFADAVKDVHTADEPLKSTRHLTSFIQTLETAVVNQSFVQGKKRGFRHELQTSQHVVRTRHIPHLVWNDSLAILPETERSNPVWSDLKSNYPGRVHQLRSAHGPKLSHIADQLIESHASGEWMCELSQKNQ